MAVHRLISLVLLMLPMKFTTSDNCSISLSSHCECTKDSNSFFHVTCSYVDVSNVTNVMTDNQLIPVVIHSLNISNNQLTDLPQQYFQHIASVTEMILSHNSFKSIPAALQQLTGVYELDLSFNQLQAIDFTTFPNLKSLGKLVVKDNKILSLQTAQLYQISKNLKKLDLSNNNITIIQPGSFSAMGNLKVLNLATNKNLKHIRDVSFPGHLERVNFESDGLEEINTCNFKSLSDLEDLNLHDNSLLCSCDLLSLYQWVDRNRKEDELHHLDEPMMWQCTKENGQKVNITEMQSSCSDLHDHANCQDAYDILSNMEEKFNKALSNFKLIKVEDNEDTEVEWTFINSSLLFGYQVQVTHKNNVVYSSSILHPQIHVYRFSSSEITSGDFNVCVQVLKNATTIVKQVCRVMTLTSLKVVIGVLAGTVFLIPFLIILICIIKKDQTKVKQYKCLVQQDSDNKKKKQAFYKQQISDMALASKAGNDQTSFPAQSVDLAPPTEQLSSTENNPQENLDSVTITVDTDGIDNPSYTSNENADTGGNTDGEISVDQLAAENSNHTKL